MLCSASLDGSISIWELKSNTRMLCLNDADLLGFF